MLINNESKICNLYKLIKNLKTFFSIVGFVLLVIFILLLYFFVINHNISVNCSSNIIDILKNNKSNVNEFYLGELDLSNNDQHIFDKNYTHLGSYYEIKNNGEHAKYVYSLINNTSDQKYIYAEIKKEDISNIIIEDKTLFTINSYSIMDCNQNMMYTVIQTHVYKKSTKYDLYKKFIIHSIIQYQ